MAARELFLVATFLFLTRGSSGVAGAAQPPAVGRGGWRSVELPAATRSFWRRKRDEEPPSYLKWVTFEGQLPADAVSNWNSYTQRTEYVCSTHLLGCNTGSYVPQRGPFCFFPYAERERSVGDFKVLVNVGNMEALDWVEDSFGGVPKNAVEGCPTVDTYVGRNRYGLGKVSKEQRAAFVVVDGEELWFKWYQVLVVKKGPVDVTISHLLYNLSGAVEKWEDVTLRKRTVRNEGCRVLREVVTLEEVTETEHNWVTDRRVFSTVRGVLRAAPLTYNGTGWEVTNLTTTFPWVGEATAGRYDTHSQRLEEELPPGTACALALEGRRGDVRVPFTARLSRDFGDGRPHRVAVTGWARSRRVVGVHPGLKECWPIAGDAACSHA